MQVMYERIKFDELKLMSYNNVVHHTRVIHHIIIYKEKGLVYSAIDCGY